MNYIISSIVLLVVVIIIIYILSIDNNIDKLKNKIKDIFKVAKSKDINYINENDSLILLKYLKTQYGTFDNIMIPKKIFYNKENDYYIMKNINIIGYKIFKNSITETPQNITIKFIPIKNELFIGQYSLFGLNGNYYIVDIDINKTTIKDNMAVKLPENLPENLSENLPENSPSNKPTNIENNILENNISENNIINDTTINNSSDMIPDIIHLSSDDEDEIIATKKVRFNNA